MKKVVALSTLSQMGFSVLVLGLGFVFLSLLHLISHALFKSTLFIQVGHVIHSFFSQQDGRGYSGLYFRFFYFQVQLILTLFCLCGLLFVSGSVSKEIILFYFFGNIMNYFFGVFYFFVVFITFIYSFVLWSCLFNISSLVFLINTYSILFLFLSFPLFVFSVFFNLGCGCKFFCSINCFFVC